MRWRRGFTGWLIALALLACGMASSQAAANRLDTIRARGALVVGVKTEYPPFGSLDADGKIVGLEPDMAADLARRLHVELRLVGVNTANRLQKLQDGTVDLLIATLGDTPKRREIVTLISPDYYASGVSIMMPATKKPATWRDLQGQSVCTTQGAFFNRAMSQRYLFDLQVYNGTRDAMLALGEGRCVGWLYDDTAIATALNQPEWHDFAMPLPSLLLSPWAIAIRQGEDGAEFERLISDSVVDWHRSGFLIGLESRWRLQPSKYLQDARDLWSRRDANGEFLCARLADGNWPAACQDQVGGNQQDMTGLERFGARINDLTGLDFSILYDGYDRSLFLHGLLMSLALIVACVAGSIAVAALGAIALDARVPVIGGLVGVLTTFARMTPPLLQLYVVVFGIGSVTARWGFTLNAFIAAALCLSLYAGSASAMALIEAAAAIRHRQPDFRITPRGLPIAFGLAYQPVMASLVNIVKATGMASAVAVPELISSSTAIIAERGNSSVMMNVLMVTYFLIVLGVIQLVALLHRRVVQHAAA
jgi:polar amino acid transport system substrate-binding protein